MAVSPQVTPLCSLPTQKNPVEQGTKCNNAHEMPIIVTLAPLLSSDNMYREH